MTMPPATPPAASSPPAQPSAGPTAGPSAGELVLTPPEPVAPIAPEQAATMMPISSEARRDLDRRAAAYVESLSKIDPHSPEFLAKIGDIATLGDGEVRSSSQIANRMLGRSDAALAGAKGEGADAQQRVAKGLVELRRTVVDLDPKDAGRLTAGKFLSKLPFGNSLRDFVSRYQSASVNINGIIPVPGLVSAGAIETQHEHANHGLTGDPWPALFGGPPVRLGQHACDLVGPGRGRGGEEVYLRHDGPGRVQLRILRAGWCCGGAVRDGDRAEPAGHRGGGTPTTRLLLRPGADGGLVGMAVGRLPAAGGEPGERAAGGRALPPNLRAVPVFPILFGEGNVAEMRALAALTGGRLFGARTQSLASAFREIRGYQ